MCLRTLIQLRIFEFFGLAVANLAKRKQYHDNVTFLNLFGKFSFILQSLLAVESKSVLLLAAKILFLCKGGANLATSLSCEALVSGKKRKTKPT